jgi:predicted metal-dependent phosphotriesterase family hydrolase
MSEPTIVTVRGPIPAEQLGVTLMHEHIFINLLREFRGDGLLNDPPLAARELARFREGGGATVIDVTNASLGRPPRMLQAISERVGVNIVLGAGLYRHQYFDAAWVDRTSTDAMAEWIVRDLAVGIADTGIRAGIIGEIASDEWIRSRPRRSGSSARRRVPTRRPGHDHHPCGPVAHRLGPA